MLARSRLEYYGCDVDPDIVDESAATAVQFTDTTTAVQGVLRGFQQKRKSLEDACSCILVVENVVKQYYSEFVRS